MAENELPIDIHSEGTESHLTEREAEVIAEKLIAGFGSIATEGIKYIYFSRIGYDPHGKLLSEEAQAEFYQKGVALLEEAQAAAASGYNPFTHVGEELHELPPTMQVWTSDQRESQRRNREA